MTVQVLSVGGRPRAAGTRRARTVAPLLALLATASLATACDTSTPDTTADAEPSVTDDAAVVDAESPAQEDADSAEGEDASAPPASVCTSNDDCAADLSCDVSGQCVPFTPLECAQQCSADHPCDPHTGQCRCDGAQYFADADGDGADAIVCGGDDCDDRDGEVRPLAHELCDPSRPETLARDEDCNPLTFYHTEKSGAVPADQDGDGYISNACVNVAPDGTEYRGDDCNDGSPNVHPKQTEVCDEIDNNCNKLIDEREVEGSDGSTVTIIPLGLRDAAYPDVDQDKHGDEKAAAQYFCSSYGVHPGLVFEDVPSDPLDTDPAIYKGAPEICDGKDNDGNGKVDADDSALVSLYSLPLTTYACVNSHWTITACPSEDVLWCQGPLADGCATDATLLKTCHSCSSDCKFACGSAHCDEVAKLSLGYEQSCALTAQGKVACWGSSSFGRLGRDASTDFATPRWNPYVSGVQDIASGFRHSCAILGTDQQLWCWGSNEFGQLGAAPQSVLVGASTAAAVRVQGLSSSTTLAGVTAVAAGNSHSCAVLSSGQLLCWGLQTNGRLGNLKFTATPASVGGTFRNERAIVVPSTGATVLVGDRVSDVVSVSLGEQHGCSIRKNGSVECWGDDSLGQLGDSGTLGQSASLRTVASLPATVTSISAGHFHTCAIADGHVYCWGNNSSGELGDRGAITGNAAAPVSGIEDAVEVAAGLKFTCVRHSTGFVSCWGDNSDGQLGPSGTTPFKGDLPGLPAASANFVAVAAGGQHACAMRADGQGVCWGANGFGQLGAGKASTDATGALHTLLAVQLSAL